MATCDHTIPLASHPGETDFIDDNATLIALTVLRAMWMHAPVQTAPGIRRRP